jgi:hypothetical protein
MISRVLLVIVCLSVSIPSIHVLAGPPFQTDDPEVVEYRHWEVDVASQGTSGQDVTSFTAPHVEIDYGIVPGIQIHLIAPLAYVKPEGGASHYGYADMEIGAMLRLIQETASRPQVAVFPIVMLPTGDKDNLLGSGEVQALLPVWALKSRGPWTTYGGVGFTINPGADNKDYWYFGWVVERDVTEHLTLGAEVFHQTAGEVGGESSTGFNAGATVDFSEVNHMLLSAGRDFSDPNETSFYAGYQLTFGP